MGTLDDRVQRATRMFIQKVSERYEIVAAILYGSYARGDNSEHSDVDLAIIIHRINMRHMDISLDMGDIAYDVLLETDIDISPIPIFSDNWSNPSKFSNPELLQNIAREGKYVHDVPFTCK